MFLHVSVIVDVCEVYVYRPQRSCGQGNIFTPVCHSVHRGGGLPQCVMGCHPPHPRSRHPPEQTPPEQTPPGADPPSSPEQTPPREADSSIRSTSGRYASYWNAFLFYMCQSFCPQGWGVLGQVPHWDQVHPPGPGTPPGAVHAERYGQQAGGTHITGMHSCLFFIFIN